MNTTTTFTFLPPRPLRWADDTSSSPQEPLPPLPLDHPVLDLALGLSNIPQTVSVVHEGRRDFIDHCIRLDELTGYGSLALALHHMFVDSSNAITTSSEEGNGLNLANAVPGHLVAYEDFEDDLLLAGDLNWRDFVRVVKKIRILPQKPKRTKKPDTTVVPQLPEPK